MWIQKNTKEDNGGRVHEQGVVLCGAHSEDDHQRVVEAECYVAFITSGGDGELTAFSIALHEGARVSIFVYGEYLVCAAVLAIYLELCAGAGECAHFLSSPRWLYAVVRCYLEQQVVTLLALKRDEVWQYWQYIALERCYCEFVVCDGEKSFLHICRVALYEPVCLQVVY